jgi:hypothetical protein
LIEEIASPAQSGLAMTRVAGLACVVLSVFPAIAAFADETTYHDSVVVLLDASCSMSEHLGSTDEVKMVAARRALTTVLEKVPDTTHVALLVFGGNGGQEWVYPLGPKGDGAALAEAIEGVSPAGGTPLGQYIKKAADRLLQERQHQLGYGSYRLLVVTDGEADDPKLVDRYTPDILSRGITMDVIGVGMKQDHMLARRVNSYRRADDASSLERAVSEVFAEVSTSTAAQGPTEDAFALTANLDPQLATAIVTALAGSGNQPIGERLGGGATSAEPSPAAAGQSSHFPAAPLVVVAMVFALILISWLRGRSKS